MYMTLDLEKASNNVEKEGLCEVLRVRIANFQFQLKALWGEKSMCE